MSYQLEREKQNLGGLAKQLTYFACSDIDYIADIVQGQIDLITFLDAAQGAESIDVSEGRFNESKNRNGTYTYNVSVVIAKDSIDLRNFLELLEKEPVIIIVEDNNNNKRFIGDKNNGCRFVSRLKTGSNVADRNSYDLEFEWESSYRAAFANNLSFEIDISCSNIVVPAADYESEWTTSIDITNNSSFSVYIKQDFNLDGVGIVSVSKDVSPNSTVTFPATFYIPAYSSGKTYNLIRSGACNSVSEITIKSLTIDNDVKTIDSDIITLDYN